MKWTKEHKAMLFSSLTNEEIAEKTGRSPHSVRKARVRYTGHAVERQRWRIIDYDQQRIRSVMDDMRLKQGEAHVVRTAMQIGAKILDVR